MALSLELWRILWWNFAYTLILTRCRQWDCQMTFGICRGFAEVQILLNLLVYLDKILYTHYYWHDLDRGIAKSCPETSSSIIDLFITRNPDNVIVSGVGEAFLDQNIRYHCPVYAVFKFDKPKHHCYKRKIRKYDDGDYERLKQFIQDFDWQSLKDHNINVYVENFTNKFLELCEMTIPNKFITIRPSDPPWFNGLVRKLIPRRKRAHRKAKCLDTAESWKTFRKLRNEVIAAIKASNNDFKNKLVNN